MRAYGKVSPRFWIGETGRKIREAGPEATIVALYLMTSPHANMLGYYYMPVSFIAHETGLSFEGASKGLRRVIEAGFCSYHAPLETVWVHKMALFQVAEELKPNDNRVKAVIEAYMNLPVTPFLSDFAEFYSSRFHLPEREDLTSPLEGASKGLRSQEQEQEQKQEQEKTTSSEPLAESESKSEETDETVIELPLNDKTMFPIRRSQFVSWVDLYPAVDVMQELRKMRGWLDANPSKRKTKRGILSFANTWLSKQQDKSNGGNNENGSRTRETQLDHHKKISNAISQRLKAATAAEMDECDF